MGMKILCLVALSIIQTVDGEMPCLQSIKAVKYLLDTNYTGQQTVKKNCEYRWKRYNNHCYYFNQDSLPWHDAEAYCNEHDSTLAKLEDALESMWTTHAGGRLTYWIGVNDIAIEGTWVWKSDSTPVVFSAWDRSVNPPKPGGGDPADCVTTYGNTKDGVWGDFPCTKTLRSICEREL